MAEILYWFCATLNLLYYCALILWYSISLKHYYIGAVLATTILVHIFWWGITTQVLFCIFVHCCTTSKSSTDCHFEPPQLTRIVCCRTTTYLQISMEFESMHHSLQTWTKLNCWVHCYTELRCKRLRKRGKKCIVCDLVCDLEVFIESLGTEPDTDWIRLNIMWNLSRVCHIRLNFQLIKVLLFKNLVGDLGPSLKDTPKKHKNTHNLKREKKNIRKRRHHTKVS